MWQLEEKMVRGISRFYVHKHSWKTASHKANRRQPGSPAADCSCVSVCTHTPTGCCTYTHTHWSVVFTHTPRRPIGLFVAFTHTHPHWGVCCIYMHAPHTHRLFVAFTHTPATQFAVFTYTPTTHLTYVCCIYTHTRVFVVFTHTHRTPTG